MNLDKIPFEIKWYDMFDLEGYVFVESNTNVFTRSGAQFTTLSCGECRLLLNTSYECQGLYFGADVSLNVLIVLKVGI